MHFSCINQTGLVVASDYRIGKQMVKQPSFKENAEFFQNVFEIGRRHKIMNPGRVKRTLAGSPFTPHSFSFFFLRKNEDWIRQAYLPTARLCVSSHQRNVGVFLREASDHCTLFPCRTWRSRCSRGTPSHLFHFFSFMFCIFSFAIFSRSCFLFLVSFLSRSFLL